jgi:hypothetical protein
MARRRVVNGGVEAEASRGQSQRTGAAGKGV